MRRWQIISLLSCSILSVLIFCSVAGIGAYFFFTPLVVEQTSLQTESADFSTITTPTAEKPPGEAVNRLLVQSNDGNLFTINPEGRERINLTTDASGDRLYSQPTWSPQASYVAWSELSQAENNPRSFLITSNYAGEAQERTEVDFLPFYIFWSPNENQLAYLSNWNPPERMALRLVELNQTAERRTSTLAKGQPLYFSWSPEGDTLLTHIGNEDLALQSLDGAQKALRPEPARFAAPSWAVNSDNLLYAVREERGSRLVLSNQDGLVEQELANFNERISFNQSPNGQYVAYSLTEAQINLSSFGPLYLVDLSTQETSIVYTDTVVGYQWSPDSQYLAFLVPELSAPATPAPEISTRQQGQGQGALRLRWHIWNGTESYPLTAFFPTEVFLSTYLPFFDQYVQSHRFWSPDSQYLVYAGISLAGTNGIWTHPIAPDSRPTLVSEGVFATWSPR